MRGSFVARNCHSEFNVSAGRTSFRNNGLLLVLTTLSIILRFDDVTALTHIEYRTAPLRRSPAAPYHRSMRTPLLLRMATTYLPDDWVEEADDHHYDDSSTTLFGGGSSLIPPALQTPEWVAPLARLAAGHNAPLQLQHIEQVSVRNVASSHVDIEAVVCEQDGCVSLLVPVPFTKPCQPETEAGSFEDCVLRNIQELDSEQLQKANVVDLDASTVPIEYPSWWIYPTATTSAAFARECAALLDILREPAFRTDVHTVVTKELRRMLATTDDVLHVQQAHAVAVGPSGMIFRVQALYYGQEEVVDVPIPFAAGGLVSVSDQDAAALREAVLECVEPAAP